MQQSQKEEQHELVASSNSAPGALKVVRQGAPAALVQPSIFFHLGSQGQPSKVPAELCASRQLASDEP